MRTSKSFRQWAPTLAAAAVLLFALSEPAFAFRCGSRVIQNGMHEVEVIRLCGEPVSSRRIGYVVRSYAFGSRPLAPDERILWRERGYISQEVEVTEMVFNFGPRRLMRQLVFEGGILTSIRTMGYGYIDNDEQ